MEGISLLARVSRICSLVTVTLFLTATVSAYTVVMRGGRRVEIPSSFVVTKKTLTYEVSPGVQITLAIAAIDVAATEKANNEAPGSLLARGQADARPLHVLNSATRTITNRDLEPSVRRRRESEAAYELKRKQQGLPTLAESRSRVAAIPDLPGTELEQKLISERDSEAYWRARAAGLRTKMIALDAELSYVRARLDESSFSPFPGSSLSSFTILPSISFGNVGLGNVFRGRGVRRPHGLTRPRAGSQVAARVNFGSGLTRGQVFLNPGGFSHRSGFGRGHRGSFPVLMNYPQIGLIGQSYDLSYERSALITHFNELAAARAGLSARWRELEEEARRAGASPGWLRR